MSPKNIIRAWKDEEYRLGLSEAEQALLPAHPAGRIELQDADLSYAAGGYTGDPDHVDPPSVNADHGTTCFRTNSIRMCC